MTDSTITTRDCASPKCRLQVWDALAIADRGGHREVVLDPAPATWDQGGRYRLRDHQPGGKPHVTAVTTGRAFGARTLYRKHDACGSGKTTRPREAS